MTDSGRTRVRGIVDSFGGTVGASPRGGSVQSQPFWLEIGDERVFACLDAGAAESCRDVAVVMCPPFGWEEMCSHRARRTWARSLAENGIPTLRIDLPGAGDSSGGPHTPGRVAAWKDAVAGAAGWLRTERGASRVVAIGIGAGGLISVAAMCAGAPVDDLILWGVPARGRTLIRELRVYAGIVSARYPGDEINPLPDLGELPEGAIEATGFVMSAETAADLEAIDLTKLEIPDAAGRRVILIERDSLGVDARLRAHLEEAGTAVTVLEASDYESLMAHPQEARAPVGTIRASIEWLTETGDPAPRGPADETVVRAVDVTTMPGIGCAIRETAISLTNRTGRSHAILSTPESGPQAPICAVLLNAGALRRTGPNRTWVELARRWASLGVPTVRIDFEGIGDSEGDEAALTSNVNLYSQAMTDETRDVLGQLADRDLPQRFVLVGLCSGAYWALHAALADERVAGAFLVNLYSFYWSEELVAERDRRETVAALRTGILKRIAAGGIRPYHIRRAMRSIRGGRGLSGSVEGEQATEVGLALDRLRDQGTEVLLALSGGEPLYDQFEREGRIMKMATWPNVRLERMPSQDHMVRAPWAQALVHQHLDRSLRRVLAASGVTPSQTGAAGESVACPPR